VETAAGAAASCGARAGCRHCASSSLYLGRAGCGTGRREPRLLGSQVRGPGGTAWVTGQEGGRRVWERGSWNRPEGGEEKDLVLGRHFCGQGRLLLPFARALFSGHPFSILKTHRHHRFVIEPHIHLGGRYFLFYHDYVTRDANPWCPFSALVVVVLRPSVPVQADRLWVLRVVLGVVCIVYIVL